MTSLQKLIEQEIVKREREIAALNTAMQALAGGRERANARTANSRSRGSTKRKPMSAAARKRIGEGIRASWAKRKAATKGS